MMMIYRIEDISDAMIQYSDKYVKRVIINTKNEFFRQRGKAKHYGIFFESLEENKYLVESENISEKIPCCYFRTKGVSIPVFNPKLASAIAYLTETQRTVLLQNIVLGIPMQIIANDLKLNKRTIEKHKHNAIEIIRTRMAKHER